MKKLLLVATTIAAIASLLTPQDERAASAHELRTTTADEQGIRMLVGKDGSPVVLGELP